MELKNTHKYDDIIDLPRPVSQRCSRMTNYDRAAQFSPFAALTGFDAAIEETARLTDTRIELDEDGMAMLDETMSRLRELLPSQPEITATWFVNDERKAGGAYVTARGRAKRLDLSAAALMLTDGTVIPIPEIIHLQLMQDGGKL